MKRKKSKLFSIVTLFVLPFLFINCNDDTSVEEEFEDINGVVKEKLLKRIVARNSSGEQEIINFNYNGDNKLSSIYDGYETMSFNYDSNGNLIEGDSQLENDFTVSEFYKAPYDVFDKGEVLEYDDNNNPSKVLVFEYGYNSNSFIGDIFYDPNPNPFFYTLKSASIIDVLDNVQLNFGYQNAEIVKARNLLPNNNVRGMIFKNQEGITTHEVQFDFEYDDDGYPIRSEIFIYQKGESSISYIDYYYK